MCREGKVKQAALVQRRRPPPPPTGLDLAKSTVLHQSGIRPRVGEWVSKQHPMNIRPRQGGWVSRNSHPKDEVAAVTAGTPTTMFGPGGLSS